MAISAKKRVIGDVTRLPLTDDRTPVSLGQGMRVVIADDERDTVMTLGILLRSEGFDVELLQGGADVPAAVRSAPPVAVILDIGMPDRDGYQVARELRQSHGERCPLLVAVTARVSAADRAHALASGFHHFFPKPYDPVELLELLSSLRPAA